MWKIVIQNSNLHMNFNMAKAIARATAQHGKDPANQLSTIVIKGKPWRRRKKTAVPPLSLKVQFLDQD